MQPRDAVRTEDSMNFDDRELWKPVIDGPLKIPSPIVDRLIVPQDETFHQYPKAEKKLLWRDALEERYAGYTRPDGLVRRFFIFRKNLSDVVEVREQFQSLRGRLVERRILMKEQEMHETFESGHRTSVTSHRIKHGQWRLLEFELGQRLDSLLSRLEVFGQKIVEKFGPRDDGLRERKITIVPDSAASTSTTSLYKNGPKVDRITQKYRPKDSVTSHHTTTFAVEENTYKVWFNRVDDSMGIVYHHQPGRITNFSIEYRKEHEKDKEFVPEPSKFDPMPPEIDQWKLTKTQNELLQIREKAQNDARKIAEEVVRWIEFRSEEESRPFLKMKAVDVVLHRKLFAEMEQTNIMVEQPPPEPKAEGEEGAGGSQQQLSASDPLCVYFPIDQGEMTQAAAEEISRRATEALQARLVEEQTNLQTRLNQEVAVLKKKVLEFEMDQHQSMSKKQADEHQEYCNKKRFLIAVLQKRLERFTATASRRLFDLLKQLKNHPKLTQFLGATDVEYGQVEARIKEILPPNPHAEKEAKK
jgi:hypothetical protein